MASALPDGEPAPTDGSLPAPALAHQAEVPFGVYVHVPFCAVRCGYCDFNTYTPADLGVPMAEPPSGGFVATTTARYLAAAHTEIALAGRVLGEGQRAAETVFFGGGTPNLLAPDDLIALLDAVREQWGLTPDAEVTLEANPDAVVPGQLERLRAGGFTRLSLGMQSAVPEVLATLDRTHDPEAVPRAVQGARAAGFDQVSVDLIYGTPGESLADWRRTLDEALACGPDHVSAYALIVEEGTALARRVRSGAIAAPDDDLMAEMYSLADERLSAAGLQWYELSNWAADESARCRHNLLYWRGHNWWGIGPGAHSHVGGVRWWNVKHPTAYAARLTEGTSPAAAREVLSPTQSHLERLLLELRLAEGLPLSALTRSETQRVPGLESRGWVRTVGDRLQLTPTGRLLADGVTRELVD